MNDPGGETPASFPRRRESRRLRFNAWILACAGMTELEQLDYFGCTCKVSSHAL
jgi:hypothetical protein